MVKINYDKMALGARFSYIDSEGIWIKLCDEGCGLVAEYNSNHISDESWVGQSLGSAKEYENEQLIVIFIS